MKELSIEQKARAYDEAIKRGLDYIRQTPATEMVTRQSILEHIFPELKESEDERIRKELLNYLYDVHDDDEERARWIAWLEKQGEQKPYGQRQECVDCQFNYAGECKGSCAIKRGEQKPAWSEEDETNASYIVAALDCYYRFREERNNTNGQENLDKARNWLYNKLKSLRPQNRWKPSDEQMRALRFVIENTNASILNPELLLTLVILENKLKAL